MLHFNMVGLFFFMFLLCDADSTCTSNPLILDPPEVIGEYNTTVSLNCSSIEEDHDGLYWRGETKEDWDRSFVITPLLMDWGVEAQCRIKLMGGKECSRDVNITVYKDPEAVFIFSINDVQDAREGTQYKLQCDITDVAPVENLIVRWYKDNNIIKTQSFTNTSKTLVSESSVLTYNISRGDNGAQFRCEAQLDFGPHGPQCPNISSVVHNVSVNYAPEFKNKTDIDEVYLKEGDNVTLNCEAEGNPPPVFRWTVDGDNKSENTNNLFIHHVNDSANYSCTASNSVGDITKQIHVHVEKTIIAVTSPEPSVTMAEAEAEDCPLTLTPAEIVVRFGDRASINCSTSDTDALGIGWNATVGGVSLEERLSTLWDVDNLEDWHIEPKCFLAQKTKKLCDVMPVIILYKTPDNVSIIDPDNNPMKENEPRQLTCKIINVAPVRNLTVKWYRGNETVHTQTFDNSSVTPMNVYSTWTVTPKRADNQAQYRCEAELHLGPELIPTTSSALYTANVHYEPVINNCPRNFTAVEKQLMLDTRLCEGLGNPLPSVAWMKQDGTEFDLSKPLKRTDSGEYTVEYQSPMGTSNTSVHITVEYSPSFTCDNHRDVKEGDETKTTCEADGIPRPEITWFKDGEEIRPLKHWSKTDSGIYLFKATNIHGEANHTLNLNVLYAPEIKEENEIRVVTENRTVNFACSAEGNPLPDITWEFKPTGSMTATTWGRLKDINITKATSNNTGVYSCTATNKVGNDTRYFTLTMPGKTYQGYTFPLWILILICAAVIIIILTTLIIYTKRRKNKKGQYSFSPVQTKDDSNIPMDTMSK